MLTHSNFFLIVAEVHGACILIFILTLFDNKFLKHEERPNETYIYIYEFLQNHNYTILLHM